MDAAEVLEKAAREVDKGWTRGKYQEFALPDSDGAVRPVAVCSVGALRRVIFGDDLTIEQEEEIYINPLYNQCLHVLAQTMYEQFGACCFLGSDDYSDYRAAMSVGASDFHVVTCTNDVRATDKSEIVACMEKAAAKLHEACE